MNGIAPIFPPGFGTLQRLGREAEERGKVQAARSERAAPGAWRGRPHDDAAVAGVKSLVTGTALTYGEIAERTGIRAGLELPLDAGWRRGPAGGGAGRD